MYNKLFTRILDSSIWLENHPTRIVWMTFLAVMDEDGMCQFASVANLARRAIVTLEEARQAVELLEAPDAESSDPENDGRRVERVPGGWIILNALKYREQVTREAIRSKTRERVQRFRDKKRGVTLKPLPATIDGVTSSLPTGKSNAPVTQSVAVALVVAGTKAKPKTTTPQSGFVLPGWIDSEAWEGFEEMRRKERHPLTTRARKLAIGKLDELRATGQDPGAVLNQSTLNGWRGLFPITLPHGNGGSNGTHRQNVYESKFERAHRLLDEEGTEAPDSGAGRTARGDRSLR